MDQDGLYLPYSQEVDADVQFFIRHAISLAIRKVRSMVADRPTIRVILGRDVLSMMGLDNRTLFEDACNWLYGDV